MVNVLVTLGMILLFFLTGHIVEFIKRLVMLMVDCFLRLLDHFGLHLHSSEKNIKTSAQFKATFKEIQSVKKSKENVKLKKSINIPSLIALILSVALVILNLEILTGSFITLWLYDNTFLGSILGSPQSTSVMYTAVLFSIISFSISKLISQWKETKEIRVTKKQLKLKKKVFKKVSSKELLEEAKLKDIERYNELKVHQEE